MDDASSALGARAGIVVITLEGIKLEHSFMLGFKASNNKAEYEALLAGLRVLSNLGAKEVEIYSDSHLVVNQVQGSFEAKDPRMMEYLRLVKKTMDCFLSIKVVQVTRGQNRYADSLATLASSSTKEIPRLGVLLGTTVEPCWMDPIIDFLAENRMPADENEAKKVRQTVVWYWLSVDRKLYRRSFDGPYL